jgi:hypothetical protein
MGLKFDSDGNLEDMSDREVYRTSRRWIIYLMVGLVVMVVLLGIGGIAWKATIGKQEVKVDNELQREAVQGSPAYVAGQVKLMQDKYNDWYALDTRITELEASPGNEALIQAKKAQQVADVNAIRNYAGLIPADQVPSNINVFLVQHPH